MIYHLSEDDSVLTQTKPLRLARFLSDTKPECKHGWQVTCHTRVWDSAGRFGLPGHRSSHRPRAANIIHSTQEVGVCHRYSEGGLPPERSSTDSPLSCGCGLSMSLRNQMMCLKSTFLVVETWSATLCCCCCRTCRVKNSRLAWVQEGFKGPPTSIALLWKEFSANAPNSVGAFFFLIRWLGSGGKKVTSLLLRNT